MLGMNIIKNRLSSFFFGSPDGFRKKIYGSFLTDFLFFEELCLQVKPLQFLHVFFIEYI